jgi:hypothetical protein
MFQGCDSFGEIVAKTACQRPGQDRLEDKPMEQPRPGDLDFDAWMAMAQDDPESFEKMRLAAIEEVIQAAPERSRTRLRGLQWRIDQERRLAKSPMKACLRISSMMWRHVTGDGGLHERFAELQRLLGVEPSRTVPPAPRSTAEVLAFARTGD